MGKQQNVVIAGGGTGGHIYPGVALAEKLKELHPNIRVHFVGAVGGLEETIVPREGYPLHCLSIGRLHRSIGLWRQFKTLLGLPWSFVQALWLYLRLRPLWVLGVGGFASGPFVFVSALCGGRTAILEPNAFPGLANRYLSKWVQFCFLVFKETGVHFPAKKVRTVGLPVRISKSDGGGMVTTEFSSERPLRILVFGGSQGARAINQVVGTWVMSKPNPGGRIELLHQVGARDFAHWQEAYGSFYGEGMSYTEYIHDMPQKLEWADVCICRAGIGTVAEIAMSCTPALFVPLPSAADDHQRKNAETLVHKNAGWMALQDQWDSQKLDGFVTSLLENGDGLKEKRQQLSSIDYSSAPTQILEHLMKGSL